MLARRSIYEDKNYYGEEAAMILLARQDDGIRKLKEDGMLVKINTVVIPGVNMDHVQSISAKAKQWGADIMNCIAMIPVHDTLF